MEPKKYNKLVNTANNQTCRERTSGYQWGEGSREGKNRGRGLRCTDYYHKLTYKDILYNTGNIVNIL